MTTRWMVWVGCLAAALAWGCSGAEDDTSDDAVAATGGAAETASGGARQQEAAGGDDALEPSGTDAGSDAGGADGGTRDGTDVGVSEGGASSGDEATPEPSGTGGTDSPSVPTTSLGGSLSTGGAPGTGGALGMGGSSLGGSLSTGGFSNAAGEGPGIAEAGGSGGPEETTSNGGLSGDTYQDPGTNPFVLVSHDPLSTFAADTDTASYDLFRRDIEDGVLPNPSGVRLEEYVNFFAYDYEVPAADADPPFTLHLAAAPHILDRDTVLLRVGIQGKAAPTTDEKPPANLVFLVDVSGSMGDSDKLPLVQHLLEQSLEVLAPTDLVSIVTYSTEVQIALEPTPASEAQTIQAVIDGLAAGGSTAGAAAMDTAYELAQSAFIEGGMNHVVMCTDGDFNVGVTSTDTLVQMIEERRESGITLAVVGFGSGNLNDAMMEAISNKGDGVYAHVSSTAIADEYVADQLLSNMYFIAKDMKLQVEFNPDEVYAYRLLGYENRAVADSGFRDDTVDGGEVGAGHQVTALYELVLPGHDIPFAEGAPPAESGEVYAGDVEIAPTDLVLVKVRYKERSATVDDPAHEVTAALSPDDLAASEADLDASFQWAVAIASFAEILKQSPYGDPAQLDAIASLVHRPVHEAFEDRVEFVTLFDRALTLFE